MLKEEIRKDYKLRRRKLSSTEKDKLEDLMLIQFQKLKLPQCMILMTYAPIEVQNEYDPYLAECYAMFKNPKIVFVHPCIDTTTESMIGYITNDETLFEENRFGVLEPTGGPKIFPEDIEVMFVPLLAFSKEGYRVGYGKGYYDAYIPNCNPKMIKIGFSFFDPVEIDDVNGWDKKLNYCITPNKIYTF